MASLCCTGPDRMFPRCCRGCSTIANRVPLSARLLPRKGYDHGSARRSNDFKARPRVLSRVAGTGAGLARESNLRMECSETQTVVSVQAAEEPKIVCEACRGQGFRICDYCEGEKVNVPVKGRNNRFHRRCPECRAVGIMMCHRCKVFKCVTFPDWDDGSLEKKR